MIQFSNVYYCDSIIALDYNVLQQCYKSAVLKSIESKLRASAKKDIEFSVIVSTILDFKGNRNLTAVSIGGVNPLTKS